MLKKIILVHKINKFYNTFWEVLEYGYEFKVRNLNHNDLSDVLFDIHEILDCYDYDETDDMVVWLDKLYTDILDFRDKSPIDLNKILFHICNTKKNGFYELRRGTKPIYKLAQWLYTKGI